MSGEKYPQEVTEDNIDGLMEKAEKIREKSLQGRYVIVILVFYVIPCLLIGLWSIFLVFWLGQNHYLDFLSLLPMDLATKIFLILIIIAVGVIGIPTAIFILFSTFWFMERYLGYPKDEETIFAHCFVMARHLRNNERLKAKKEVKYLTPRLTSFVRRLVLNPRRKVYSPEFDVLRSGKNEVCRMLMFSEANISKLLMKFGLAFVRNDDPKAFSILKQLITKVREYGEPKGRFRRFLSGIEQYPHASPLLITTMIIVIAILYYLVSGQQLPIG